MSGNSWHFQELAKEGFRSIRKADGWLPDAWKVLDAHMSQIESEVGIVEGGPSERALIIKRVLDHAEQKFRPGRWVVEWWERMRLAARAAQEQHPFDREPGPYVREAAIAALAAYCAEKPQVPRPAPDRVETAIAGIEAYHRDRLYAHLRGQRAQTFRERRYQVSSALQRGYGDRTRGLRRLRQSVAPVEMSESAFRRVAIKSKVGPLPDRVAALPALAQRVYQHLAGRRARHAVVWLDDLCREVYVPPGTMELRYKHRTRVREAMAMLEEARAGMRFAFVTRGDEKAVVVAYDRTLEWRGGDIVFKPRDERERKAFQRLPKAAREKPLSGPEAIVQNALDKGLIITNLYVRNDHDFEIPIRSDAEIARDRVRDLVDFMILRENGFGTYINDRALLGHDVKRDVALSYRSHRSSFFGMSTIADLLKGRSPSEIYYIGEHAPAQFEPVFERRETRRYPPGTIERLPLWGDTSEHKLPVKRLRPTRKVFSPKAFGELLKPLPPPEPCHFEYRGFNPNAEWNHFLSQLQALDAAGRIEWPADGGVPMLLTDLSGREYEVTIQIDRSVAWGRSIRDVLALFHGDEAAISADEEAAIAELAPALAAAPEGGLDEAFLAVYAEPEPEPKPDAKPVRQKGRPRIHKGILPARKRALTPEAVAYRELKRARVKAAKARLVRLQNAYEERKAGVQIRKKPPTGRRRVA